MVDNKHKLRWRTQGSALLSALFIMTLVAIATTAMSIRLQQDIHRAQLNITSDKLYLSSQAVTFWAMGLLSRNDLPTESRLFKYPKTFQKDYPEIITTGEILDLQAKFNLNQLIDTESDEVNQLTQTGFYQLLNQILKKAHPRSNQILVEATKHWVNDYKKGSGRDEFSTHYLKQKPPYSASNQAMQSISEFRLIQGVDNTIYQAMLPYLTALPPPTPININTASVPVLMLLGNGLEKNEAESIVKARGPQGFKEMEEINALLEKYKIPVKQITLESEYFLCVATSTTHDLELVHYTIIKRVKNNEKIAVHIIHDSLNDL